MDLIEVINAQGTAVNINEQIIAPRRSAFVTAKALAEWVRIAPANRNRAETLVKLMRGGAEVTVEQLVQETLALEHEPCADESDADRLGGIDRADSESWTQDGKPTTAAASKALGRHVGSDERDALWDEWMESSERGDG